MTTIKRRFINTTWTIKELVAHVTGKWLNLQPHYQRNAIWSAPAQRRLIRTIKDGYPLPNLFVRELATGKYEMVDGQQRCRAIFAYWRGDLADDDKIVLNENGDARGRPATLEWKSIFESYPLQVSVLDSTFTDAEIEEFYVLLNTSGVRLNSPELRKAAHYDTNFLSAVNKVCDLPEFTGLNLFGPKAVDRMNDLEFVAELLTFLLHGFTNKKETVDKLFDEDVSKKQSDELVGRAETVLRDIAALDATIPIAQTRYRQKNDFYTLFAFLAGHATVSPEAKKYFYETLLRIEPYISPSQQQCEPLLNYARNCVSQSNSQPAREARNSFFVELFDNKSAELNQTQRKISDFFGIAPKDAAISKWGRLLLDNELLEKAEA